MLLPRHQARDVARTGPLGQVLDIRPDDVNAICHDHEQEADHNATGAASNSASKGLVAMVPRIAIFRQRNAPSGILADGIIEVSTRIFDQKDFSKKPCIDNETGDEEVEEE